MVSDQIPIGKSLLVTCREKWRLTTYFGCLIEMRCSTLTYMESLGIRALQQNAGAVVRKVELGDSVEITDRGRPVAILVPILEHYQTLEASGRLRRADGDLFDLPPPIQVDSKQPSPSERFRRMRADER